VNNPFLVYSPEEITPMEFKDSFVKEHTWINTLETPKDHFIYGSRGSGKSMLLTYLELAHQLCYFDNNLTAFFEKKDNKYIGIMVHATLEGLNTDRYELLVKNNLNQRSLIKDLCTTDLIMAVLRRILRTFIEIPVVSAYVDSISIDRVRGFCTETVLELDRKNIHSIQFENITKGTDGIAKLAGIFLEERDIIREYANDRFQLKDTAYEGNYPTFTFLLNTIKRLKWLLDKQDFSIYILIDNGDDTKGIMQQCIDDLIAQREHRDICVKVAYKKGTFWNLGNIQWPHDYSQIDIDELYSTQHTVYYDRVKEIANKRLQNEAVHVNIEEYLPESTAERELLDSIKRKLEKDCSKEYEDGVKEGKINRENLSKADFVTNRVSKYAQAELFRQVRKTGKSYAGFNNIVHLSSGIVRQFLDICALMFNEEVKKSSESVKQISLQTQNVVIKTYADSFIDELERKFKGLEREENTEEAKYYQGLYNLVETLGNYYKERLENPALREPRVFTFTLKDRPADKAVEKVLEIGVNENYFQSYWYSSKIGVGKYRGYAFNRRLCPRYSIDHTSFRGRIELTSSDIKDAIMQGKIAKTSIARDEKDTFTLDEFSVCE
jgi:hypothetical protein